MRVVLSWRGGVKSALALARLREAGHAVTLLHLSDAATRRDPAHGVPDFLVQEQAACLGLPLLLRHGDEAAFVDALREAAPDAVAFGGAGGEKVARAAGVEALWPLQGATGAGLMDDFLARGFRAFVCACRPPLDPSFLGRFLDAPLVGDMVARDEWHAFVVDGPLFRRRVDVTAGEIQEWNGGWRLDLGLRGC